MRTSKKVFAIITAVVAAVCALVFLLNRGGDAESPPKQDQPIPVRPGEVVDIHQDTPQYTLPLATTPSNSPTIPDSASEITVGKNVTIYKVPKDPNEVIDRDMRITPEHPEYMDAESGGYFISTEGKVYRNDRIISIDVYDAFTDSTHKISFGYITGKCNRFLYLNPIVENETCQYSFRFQDYQSKGVSGGIIDVVSPFEVDLDAPSFVTFVAADQKIEAQYKEPNYPGVFWYTTGPLNGPIYISCQVLTATGDPVALLRLVIAKDPADGTYSFANIINCNIMQENPADSIIPDADITKLYELACETMDDHEALGLYSYQIRESTYHPENFMMEIRDVTTGTYHTYYYPTGYGVAKYAKDDLFSPVVAVTYRHWVTPYAMTLYFRVLRMATATEPAIYEYIGRDSHFYPTLEIVCSNGYHGDT